MKHQYQKDREELVFNILGALFGIALIAITIYLATSGVGA